PPPPPLTATIHFAFDRSALEAGDLPALDAFVAKLKERNYSSVAVVGYADRIGEAAHNDVLSRKRADAAVAYLTSKGVDASRSHAEGKGESDAVTGDACKDLGAESGANRKLVDCLAKDRRVEVAVVN
ncbi:MAG: OmpA family protein, partial [Burkholderiales bacterium]|nr:OmpA family protein [Burkholderiales bacterium]